MKIIFAQGNPGERYKNTRHNIGFLALDQLKEAFSGTDWKKSSRANAEVSEISVGGNKVALVKPQSYYNETGLVARQLIDFYKLTPAEDFLVIHDDLALPVGSIRIRKTGSNAGNNGIKSLNQHLGTEYARIRMGIWSEKRDLMSDSDFVLSLPNKEELEIYKELISGKVPVIIESFVKGNLEPTSHNNKPPKLDIETNQL